MNRTGRRRNWSYFFAVFAMCIVNHPGFHSFRHFTCNLDVCLLCHKITLKSSRCKSHAPPVCNTQTRWLPSKELLRKAPVKKFCYFPSPSKFVIKHRSKWLCLQNNFLRWFCSAIAYGEMFYLSSLLRWCQTWPIGPWQNHFSLSFPRFSLHGAREGLPEFPQVGNSFSVLVSISWFFSEWKPSQQLRMASR